MSKEPIQRSSAAMHYRFDDRDMDFVFQMSVAAAKTGGPDAGELYALASRIEDGNTESWVKEFEAYGDAQCALAAEWEAHGRRRSAGEVLMKAYYAYRQAWQFAAEDAAAFDALIGKFESAFADAARLTELPLTYLEVPFGSASLPGLRLDAGPEAPTLLLHGGLDTTREDVFHLIGLNAWRRGYTAVMVDLPGQGTTPLRDLHLMSETERPIGAVIDHLVDVYGTHPARLALMGMSAGGYMVSRAVMTERRVAACVASTPLYDGGSMLPVEALDAMAAAGGAVHGSFLMYLWRSGLSTAAELAELFATFRADPSGVECAFLSIAGSGEGPGFIDQARRWHDGLPVEDKTLLELDASTGADAHCQANNPTRLAQEVCDWLDDVFDRRGRTR
ncbi:alpha/beta hydrolase family protein [Streptomyces sulphureus]|uniref:alpha/beta hydrolase family protein n=1 Tax=Streptomyces sulphureus TaxID=47758 RepID=UPI00131A101D|nr:alpha/beta fold hydrolase [Streptomyces sulphureus]